MGEQTGAAAPARIAVLGLWHLGSVTAACLAEAGFEVVGIDPDPAVVQDLLAGRPVVSEPGLADLISAQQARGRLRFTGAEDRAATAGAQLVWIAFDTPVDDRDVADSDWVLEQAAGLLRRADPGTLVVVSAQLPVGSIAALERTLAAAGRDDLRFACVPENLRLGRALDTFRAAERFVVGTRNPRDLDVIAAVLAPFGAELITVGVESAEMTKHALNAFLATSVTFINEVASICELVGADAEEVSRGLRSDARIGPRAYLSPGDAFAGGTLARDVRFLQRIAAEGGLEVPLTQGVTRSNDAHRRWARRALARSLDLDPSESGGALLAGRRIAVWGLPYKPGTSTLRRSSALDLCAWLREHGAEVRAHDPAVDELPAPHGERITLATTPGAALEQADALVVCTAWPEYREVPAAVAVRAMRTPVVLDAAGHVSETLGRDPAIAYARVGVVA
jgi:UDPglucose 6-dehydrogenase